MEISEMTIEQIESRVSEIKSQKDSADLETVKSFNAEMDQLEARRAELKATAEAKKELRDAIAKNEVHVEPAKIEIPQEERKMEEKEIRNSKAYLKAFRNYVMTSDDTECRSLLTTNVAGGQIVVPDVVDRAIRTAWEKNEIMSLVKKVNIKGNIKIGFEISATGAVIHTEGAAAPAEETIVLGIVSIVPQTFKKWITFSDEVLDMDDGSFLEYIYSEITYQIVKKAADELIATILACGTVSTNTPTTNVAVPKIATTQITMALVASAIAQLSDQATNNVIVMNKLTYANFKKVAYANGYAADPFEGLPVKFSSKLTSFDAATTGVPFMIVGDFGNGALANMPIGDSVKFTYDDKSLAEKDLVKLVGREPIGIGVVAEKSFVTVTK